MLCFTDYLPSQSDPAGREKNKNVNYIYIANKNDENSCYQFSFSQPYTSLFFALMQVQLCQQGSVPKVSS